MPEVNPTQAGGQQLKKIFEKEVGESLEDAKAPTKNLKSESGLF